MSIRTLSLGLVCTLLFAGCESATEPHADKPQQDLTVRHEGTAASVIAETGFMDAWIHQRTFSFSWDVHTTTTATAMISQQGNVYTGGSRGKWMTGYSDFGAGRHMVNQVHYSCSAGLEYDIWVANSAQFIIHTDHRSTNDHYVCPGGPSGGTGEGGRGGGGGSGCRIVEIQIYVNHQLVYDGPASVC